MKPSQAPRYEGATIGLLVGYAIKFSCHLALLSKLIETLMKRPALTVVIVYMFLSNRHRNKTYGPPNKEASHEAGMRDQTEFENKDFRYVL